VRKGRNARIFLKKKKKEKVGGESEGRRDEGRKEGVRDE
jgi:hypothetical protein